MGVWGEDLREEESLGWCRGRKATTPGRGAAAANWAKVNVCCLWCNAPFPEHLDQLVLGSRQHCKGKAMKLYYFENFIDSFCTTVVKELKDLHCQTTFRSFITFYFGVHQRGCLVFSRTFLPLHPDSTLKLEIVGQNTS